MLEIAQNLERTAAGLRPAVLIGLGLAATSVGLFVWLGGLGLRKALVAIVGAIGGAICGFFIAGGNVVPVMVSAAAGAVITVIFEKVFITIMAAGLAAVSGFAVLAELYGVDFSDGLRQACSEMPLFTWAIIAALAVAFIVAGFYLWRLTSALCCATLGTMLVFAGMILLLLYKGAAPVSSICTRGWFYAAVFAAMTAFGTIEQLLLCKRPPKKPTAKKDVNKDKETSDEPRMSWRTG